MANPASALHATRGRSPRRKPIPVFACPGMKDVPLGYAVFPLGDGFTKPRPCPARDLCLWYAAHDLGGTTSFNELPTAMLIPAVFRSHPFFCALFREYVEPLLRRVRRHRRTRRGGLDC